MAEFKLSSLGRWYVTDEGLSEVPLIRIGFVIITIILGIGVLLKLAFHFFSLLNTRGKRQRRNETLSTALFLTHFISYGIHATHYADNIYRPVAYLEPRWLYVKYILSEMEITFFVNFPITIVGLIGIQGLLFALKEENYGVIRTNCKRLVFYIIGSLLTLGHYRTEFPSKYSAIVNFTIAGEGIATIVLALLLWKCWRDFVPGKNVEGDIEVVGKLLEADEEPINSPNSSRTTRSRTPIKSKKSTLDL